VSAPLSRRGLLAALAAIPAGVLTREAAAAEYKDPAEVLRAIDRLAQSADARLGALAQAFPPAAAFVASARRDLARHWTSRARLFRGEPADIPAPDASLPQPRSLPLLRTAIEELMHAHAEGLPALGDRQHVQHLAEHMVDLSRLLTVVDLWIEMEAGDE
jgi:hypothetical protein